MAIIGGTREVREAVAKKRDVALATGRAEALKQRLREAGAAVYSQTPESPSPEERELYERLRKLSAPRGRRHLAS